MSLGNTSNRVVCVSATMTRISPRRKIGIWRGFMDCPSAAQQSGREAFANLPAIVETEGLVDRPNCAKKCALTPMRAQTEGGQCLSLSKAIDACHATKNRVS